jgi:hypothetical protein
MMATKKDEGFLLDREGNPVQSSSGPVRSGSYNDEKVTQNRMEAGFKQLAQDVQDKLKADKAKDDADFAAEDARSKTGRAVAGAPAKKAPIVTKEQLAKSGLSLRDYMNKQKGLTRRGEKAASPAEKSAPKATGAMIQSMDTDMMRTAGRTAAKAAGASRKSTAQKDEDMKAYKPRPTPGARAPKQTVSKPAAKKPYMPEQPDMSYRKGGKINGIAKRGLTKCKIV